MSTSAKRPAAGDRKTASDRKTISEGNLSSLKKVRPGFILTSSCFTLPPKLIRNYEHLSRPPRVGDVMYGKICYIGQHSSLENKEGRIHAIHDGSRAVFVFGCRYAPDYYEGIVPDTFPRQVDLLARSGLVGKMVQKNDAVKDPTQVEVLGYVVDEAGQPLNTLNYAIAKPRSHEGGAKKRAKLILHVGTSMNAGKSTSAVACVWGLSAMGHAVRGAKVTGTASLKDILHMQDAGAEAVADFTYLGYPSTYLLDEEKVLEVFKDLDFKYANNANKYWVVEVADGILQRETTMLLKSDWVRSRIHRLIFSAGDALGAIGGVRILRDEFGLEPHAISGRCSSSPLAIQELQTSTRLPVFNNMKPDLQQLSEILL